MRVAFVGVDAPGALAHVLATGAEQAGHEAVAIDARRLVSGWRPLLFARRFAGEDVVAAPLAAALLGRLVEARPDAVVVVKGRFVSRRLVRRLRAELDAPVLNYYPDHPLWPGHHEPRLVDALREYDEVIVWGEHVEDALRQAGIERVRVVGFGYPPAIYRPAPFPVEHEWEVAMVGQCYPNRVAFVEALRGRRMLVAGPGWPAALRGSGIAARGSGLPAAETCRAYWRSCVALNILADQNVPSHNMRTYEIPASGTAMVATRTPVHEELFGEDGAVLVSSPEEARRAVVELLLDDDRRLAIAAAGRRSVEPWTYARRVTEILEPWRH